MELAGLLIFIALVAAFVCGKAGSVMGALFFLTIALLVFVTTPAGAGLPAAVVSFFNSVSEVTSPALNGGGES